MIILTKIVLKFDPITMVQKNIESEFSFRKIDMTWKELQIQLGSTNILVDIVTNYY